MGSTGTGEIGVLLGVLSALLTYCVIPVLLVLWGRRVARRKGGARGWRVVSWLPLAALGFLVAGMGISIVALLASFRGVAMVEAASRATLLARGISGAMTFAAAGMAVSAAVFVFSLVAFVYGEWTTRGR